jgi:hypothetical protein
VEETSILKKLCATTTHRNVVKYVDSWEEDKMLFILTELYPLGNFAHFLSEYGVRFERLEEVRCWKILADLSSVSIIPLEMPVYSQIAGAGVCSRR